MKFVIVSEKQWHNNLPSKLQSKLGGEWILIDDKNSFTADYLETIKPDKIFIPHWSYIIPKEIYSRFECIVFHMTDLPFGRGGSPLQNLIVRGYNETVISALSVEKEVDSGDIYLKVPLSLSGSAEEIFIRATRLIEEMIEVIVLQAPTPLPQTGEIVTFRRRGPEDSDLNSAQSINQIYDYIRMLDSPGYPPAFIDFKGFRLEFTKAKLNSDNTIIANVRISER